MQPLRYSCARSPRRCRRGTGPREADRRISHRIQRGDGDCIHRLARRHGAAIGKASSESSSGGRPFAAAILARARWRPRRLRWRRYTRRRSAQKAPLGRKCTWPFAHLGKLLKLLTSSPPSERTINPRLALKSLTPSAQREAKEKSKPRILPAIRAADDQFSLALHRFESTP
jgi:hypothetical protein